MSTPSSIREMLEGPGQDEQPEPSTDTGKEQEETKDTPEEEVPPPDKDDKGGEPEGEVEPDETDVDEDDDTEPPVKTKEPSLITKLKQEAGGKELLKKFPELEDGYFKFKEYVKIVPTIEEAKEAKAKADYITNLVPQLMDGNIEQLLDDINDKDPEAAANIALNFLPLINKKSPKLFNAMVLPVINNLFARLAAEAESTGNEDLSIAVEYIATKVLGKKKPEFTKVRSFSKKNEEVDQARKGADEDRVRMFTDTVAEAVESKLDEEINRGLDPDNVLSAELRTTAVEKIRTKVLQMLKGDAEHMAIIQSLYRSAQAGGFSKEHRQKVVRQIVNASRDLIPDVRARTKKSMFGNMFAKKSDNEGAVEQGQGTRGGGNNLPFDPAKVDFNKTSLRDALDFDASKVTMKK